MHEDLGPLSIESGQHRGEMVVAPVDAGDVREEHHPVKR